MTDSAAAPVKSNTPRWGMVIDVNRCVGCQTCSVACKHANDTLPGVQWRKVIDVEAGVFPDVQRLFLVTGCQHCAEPPCVPVCPTGATRQREDGLVTQDYDICIGCAYCAVACPYQARTIVHDQRWYYGRETVQEQAVKHDDRLGVAQKCTFCKERVDDGLAHGLRPGIDPAATPACASACIASAISFGDFKDPESNVSKLVRDNPYFQMHAELGTDPQIKYLYTTPAVPGREPESDENDDERMSDSANPLVGQRQTFWDWRAAMNWIFGGIGSGLAVAAWVVLLAGLVPPSWPLSAEFVTLLALLLACALMAVGLFFVWLKIGRKFRAWRAAMRPRSSWMSRELYVVAAFYGLIAASIALSQAALIHAAAAAALLFLVCQAKILHQARGIPAWRVPLIPWMIVASGLLEGFGALALANLVFYKWFVLDSPWLGIAGLALVAVNLGLWHVYRRTAKVAGIGPLARAALKSASPALHIVGHGVPALSFLAAVLDPRSAPAYLGLGGIAAIAGGAVWKCSVIVRAGYQQGFALAMLPQRGSGRRAAPTRLGGTTLRGAATRAAAE